MKNISTNTFWFLFLAFQISFSVFFMEIVYNAQRGKLNDNLKDILVSKGNILNYNILLMLKENRLTNIKYFMDSAVVMEPSIKALSLYTKESNRVEISTDKNQEYRTFHINSVNIKDFERLDNIEHVQAICFDTQSSKYPPTKKNSCLLIELDSNYINNFFNSQINKLLIQLLVMFITVLILLVVILDKIFVAPLTHLKENIESKNLHIKEYFLSDLTYLNKIIVEDFKTIDAKNILLDTVINTTDDLIFFKNSEFKYMGCNDAFTKLVGKSKEEIVGHDDFDLFEQSLAQRFQSIDKEVIQKYQKNTNFVWVTYPNGEKVYLQTQKNPFHYCEEEIGILGVSRDITMMYLAQKEIKAKTYIDELTGINNRKSFNKRLDEMFSIYERYNTIFSMLLFDIDDFKSINDTYGHIVGDEVLVAISQLIKNLIRESDHIFRIGGEEFTLLFPHTTLPQAKVIAEKIREHVQRDLTIIEDRKITISIGLSQVEQDDDADRLFKRVDDLMYHSKRSGKNRVSLG